jgi:ornithine decarboxylase
VELLLHAKILGPHPVGTSFYVGSQQTDPTQWATAIGHAAHIFLQCQRQGVGLEPLNVGGGLPAQYRTPVPPLENYVETITNAIARHFGDSTPQLMIEPGRYMVADAGILRSQVLLIARRGNHDRRRWVYLDAGCYNGLPETQGERFVIQSGPHTIPSPANRPSLRVQPVTALISSMIGRGTRCRPR